MNSLLDKAPYEARDDELFLEEMKRLDGHHRQGCAVYASIHPGSCKAQRVEDLPYLHIGMFKHFDLRTHFDGARFERTLRSSATSGGTASRIALDRDSTEAQSASSRKIFEDFIGDERRPLLIFDSSKSLRMRGEVSARIAAAMSLRPFADEIRFLLEVATDPETVAVSAFAKVLAHHRSVMVYGFTSILWKAWNVVLRSADLRRALREVRIDFVHSGGWKKLEAERVDRRVFDERLLTSCAEGSRVTDYYGLVEQAGMIYPLCSVGYRHVPVWADVLVRDPYTGACMIDQTGQIHLLNALAMGSPYHSVLTEDLGRIVDGSCPCGRSGRRFEVLGRMPRADLRGCANV